MRSSLPETAARAALAAWSVLTCVFASLCALPYVYKNFIEAKIYPSWVGYFLALHPFLTAAVLAGAGVPLTRRRAWLGVSLAVLSVFLVWPLQSLSPGPAAYLIMCLGVLPLIGWETLLAFPRLREFNWNAPVPVEGAAARLLGAVSAGVLCAAASLFSQRQTIALSIGQSLILYSASALQHAVLFAFAAALLEAARRAAASARRPQAALASAEALLALIMLKSAASGLLLNPLDMRGGPALAAAWAWSAGALAVWLGAGLALRSREPAPRTEFLLPALGSHAGLGFRSAALAAAAAAPAALAWALARSDWNGMILMIGVAVAWLIAFAVLRPSGHYGGEKPAGVLACALLLTAWLTAGAASAMDPVLRLRGLSTAELMSRASTRDPALRIARRSMSWRSRTGFFETLRRNTNISREETVVPRRIDLVEGDWTPTGEKPPIFMFVIDSLRRDYIGAYNPSARFTPAIDAFARESVVWKKSYTAYGATGLSEPSIWAGSMLLHKLYVTPFSPMNSLERLLDRLGYRKFLTRDSIVDQLWTKGPELVDLEEPGTVEFSLCRSLRRVARIIDSAPAGRPLFFYSQPQDIHVATIERQKRSNVTGKAYPGFDAAYAGRLEQVDACFGEFIAGLKSRGLYDKSLVVLASDHGDSLGEDGRWGHAYTIFPEILRVPLIMHLPKKLAASARVDGDGPAYLIDITPTFYQLLGQGSPRLNPLLGRPLISLDGSDPAGWRKPEQLLASSYGPVYGLLREGGRLFIGDGVNFRYHQYDLEGPAASQQTTPAPEAQAEGEASVRAWLDRLNAFWERTP